jgi:hypothetical protein
MKNRSIDKQFPHWAKGLTAQIALFVSFLLVLSLTAAVFGLLGQR